MTSITAPKIDANLPATPAHEWATETSSKLEETKVAAADDSSSHPPPLATAISTPGAEFPGSYPREEKETEEGGQSGILDAAKQYLPGQQDVQGALLNATETAKQYLPTSVAAYLPGGGNKEKVTTTTLPSQEGPLELSREGVGSLPGSASETSVAKLPEERAIRDQEMTTTTTLPSQDDPQKPLERSDGVGSLPGNASESSVAQLPEERATGMNTTTTLPTQEGAQKPSEHSGGIGSLPGNASESSVAKLPGEAQATAMTTSDLTPATSGEKMQSHSESVSNSSMQAQLGETPTMTPVLGGHRTPTAVSGVGDHKSESTLAERKPEEGNAHSEPNLNLTPRTHPLGAKGAQWKGAAVDEDILKKMDAHETRDRDDVVTASNKALPSVPAPRQESEIAVTGHESLSKNLTPPSEPNGSRFTETPSDGTRKNYADDASSDGSRSVGGTPRKPKFMDKLKGEMKVISGKLGGKEDKVEEGRRMMGKV